MPIVLSSMRYIETPQFLPFGIQSPCCTAAWTKLPMPCIHREGYTDQPSPVRVLVQSRGVGEQTGTPLSFRAPLTPHTQYDECKTRTSDAIHSFQKCLELNPGLTQVEARLKVLEDWTYMAPAVQPSDDHRIHRMLETKLWDFSDEESTSEGAVSAVDSSVDDDPGSIQNQELDER